MIKHYEGPLGTFDYDDEEFEVSHSITGNECLHYHGTGSSVDLPEGCINMSYMFYNCTLPEGFTLGDKFDTSKVTNTCNMFYNCTLPPEISKYEDPCDIVSWLKVPTKPEVWRILNQGLYEEEFYPQAEKIYDCVKYLVCTCGNITVDGKNVPAMRVLFDMWNNYSNETFKILEALVHESESDSAPQQMNLF